MIKSNWLLLVLLLVAIYSCSHKKRNPFLDKLFMDLKNKDSVDFANHYISDGQYGKLLSDHFKIGKITRDSMNNAPISNDSSNHTWQRKRFLLLLKQADSLGIVAGETEYDSCKFEVVNNPKLLCVSSRGIIYFSTDSGDFRWVINEALLIKGEWRIIDPGRLYKGNEGGFLPVRPDDISAFGTLSKTKVRVVLAPPPPDTQKPPPPPPPPLPPGRGN
jgi:hypothetical protein